MPEVTVAECDYDSCDAYVPLDELADGWATLDIEGGTTRYFCPGHADLAAEGGESARLESSREDGVTVRLGSPGTDHEYAYAHVATHGITIYDERADPSTEGDVIISVDDHATFRILGQHKDQPLVILESGEHPTDVQIEDAYDSFEVLELCDGLDEQVSTPTELADSEQTETNQQTTTQE